MERSFLWLCRSINSQAFLCADPRGTFCCCSFAELYPPFCNPIDYSTPGSPVLYYLPELAQIHVHWVSDAIQHLILCRPLFLLPSVFPSIRVFSNEFALHTRWPKYWSFSFSIGPSNEYSVLISFRIDWFDLLAVQEILKSLLQHHNLKALFLQCSASFMVQPSHPYLTAEKTVALTIWDFVAKWCPCFLICCLDMSQLSFQGASVFSSHGCTHCLQWFWSPRK